MTHEDQLYGLLKEAAEATPGDETSVAGENTAHDTEEGEERSSGDVDAPWGEAPPKNPMQFSRQALSTFKKSREKLLSELLSSKGSSDKAEQGLVAQQLAHGKGDFETSSPQLSGKAKSASLTTRVRELTGRH